MKMNPDDQDAEVRALEAKPVNDVIDDLLAATRRRHRGEKATIPLMALYLRSGHTVSGWLLDVRDERSRDGHSLLVHLVRSSPGRDRGSDVLYVKRDQVEAIAIFDSAPFLAELRLQDPAPTRLELERRAGALSDALDLFGGAVRGELAWEGSNSDEARSLAETIDVTRDALQTIGNTDDLGREAVRDIGVVRFTVGPKAGVAREGAMLVITAPPHADDRLSRPSLVEMLDGVL